MMTGRSPKAAEPHNQLPINERAMNISDMSNSNLYSRCQSELFGTCSSGVIMVFCLIICTHFYNLLFINLPCFFPSSGRSLAGFFGTKWQTLLKLIWLLQRSFDMRTIEEMTRGQTNIQDFYSKLREWKRSFYLCKYNKNDWLCIFRLRLCP